jgi:SAM-dependent methyltransferase
MAKLEIFDSRSGPPTARIIKGKSGAVSLHSSIDPEAEARRFVETADVRDGDLAVILGHGLGYHTRALLDRFPGIAAAVIEPNRRLLDAALKYFPADAARAAFAPRLHPRNIADWIAALEPGRSVSFFQPPYASRIYGLYFHTVRCAVELKIPRRVRSIRLDLGSGSNGMPNHIHCDIRPVRDIELVCDISRVPLEDGIADEVFSAHAIEHFPRRGVPAVLREWHRLVKPGGLLTVCCPNIAFLCLAFSQNKLKCTDELSHFIYGGQDYGENYHKCGFDFPLLEKLLLEAGFARVEEGFDNTPGADTIEHGGAKLQYHLRARAFK